MYESFFGLREKAFNLTPDPDFLYLNSRTREAFDNILYGIERREGFAVIVGDVGTGKTTLCCALLDRIEGRQNICTVLIQNPMLSELEILRSILQDLGIRPHGDGRGKAEIPAGGDWTRDLTKKELIDYLNTFLAERAREDAFTVLIIDESQNLPVEMFEQLRLLSNLETTKKKLLQIIFFGQLELAQKLAQLPQLNQRISFRFQTEPLSREDTRKYILHRLTVAAETQKIRFEQSAFGLIYRYSRGYPRLINLICDRTLREGYRERSLTVRKPMVRKAAASLGGREFSWGRGRRVWPTVAGVLLVAAVAAGLGLWRYAGKPTPAGQQPRSEAVRGTAKEPAPPQEPAPRQETPPKQQPGDPRSVPEAPVRAPEAEARKASRYYLQVYSFRTADAAGKAAKELEALNFPSLVIHHPGEAGGGWHGVYVGPFEDSQEAQRAAAELHAATGAPPVLRERVVK
jgi:general secretion pathway protein A